MELSFKCQECGERLPYIPTQVGTLIPCTACENQLYVPLTTVSPGMVENNLWLQKHIGSGNIGDVYAGKDLSTQSKAFIKVLSPAIVPQPETAQAFLTEMSRWQQVDDSHFLTFSAVGMIADQVCMVMPFVEGECLDKLIERTGPMEEKAALKVATKVASLLNRAWKDHGLCHRDLRPSNILLTDRGDVYLLDMGNVKRYLTNGGQSLVSVDFQGTVADYMAPEEHEEYVEPAPTLDIYALGATLFFLLTGQKPFTGSDSTQVIRRHLFAKVPNAQDHEPSVSNEMAKLVKDMMTKDPEKRIQNWREVSQRLKRHLKRHTQRVATGELQITSQTGEHAKQSSGGGLNIKIILAVTLGALFLLPILSYLIISLMTPPERNPRVASNNKQSPARRRSRVAPKNIPKVTVRVTADDSYILYVNGTRVGSGSEWQHMFTHRDLSLREGKNVIAIQANNNGQGTKWMICELAIGKTKVGTGSSWRCSSVKKPGWQGIGFNDNSWGKPRMITTYLKGAQWKEGSTLARRVWVNNGNAREAYFRFTIDIRGKKGK